ncbi:MAG: DUF934 domain-containing protein [Rhodomicrobium sp.]
MRYIKDGAAAADPWVYVEGDEPVPPDLPAIVSPDWLFAAGRGAAAGRSAHLGVAWPNDRLESELEPYLSLLSLIALEFPVFRDGRAYTQARRLRERYGFKGEIRATGDVLRDQFLFMVRAGFNAFEVKKAADAEAFTKALGEIGLSYQPAGSESPAFRARLPFTFSA